MVGSSAIFWGIFFTFRWGLVVALWFSSFCFLQDEGPTVEGRNPAPVELGSLSQSSVFTRFYISKVVSRISSINSIITDSSITAPPSLESFKPGGGGGRLVWVFHYLGNLPKV